MRGSEICRWRRLTWRASVPAAIVRRRGDISFGARPAAEASTGKLFKKGVDPGMSDWFFRGDYSLLPVNIPTLLLGLLLSFLCGQVVAWTYMATHTGLSYSRSFVSSLVVMPILVALVMQVLNNNIVTAFG